MDEIHLKQHLKSLKEHPKRYMLGVVVLAFLLLGWILFFWSLNQGGKVGVDENTKVKIEIQDIDNSKNQAVSNYVVKPGDSLWKLACEFYGSGYEYEEIAKANNLPAEAWLEVGQEIIIPVLDEDGSEVELSDDVSQLNINNQLEPGEAYYVVQSGDTLWDIAEAELSVGECWVELYEGNKDVIGSDPNIIFANTRLLLPPC